MEYYYAFFASFPMFFIIDYICMNDLLLFYKRLKLATYDAEIISFDTRVYKDAMSISSIRYGECTSVEMAIIKIKGIKQEFSIQKKKNDYIGKKVKVAISSKYKNIILRKDICSLENRKMILILLGGIIGFMYCTIKNWDMYNMIVVLIMSTLVIINLIFLPNVYRFWLKYLVENIKAKTYN